MPFGVRRGQSAAGSTYPEPCEECQRLTRIYVAAVERNNEAASAMAEHFHDDWPDTWREEMKGLHAACEDSLRNLDQHRLQHGR
jgi:hypothetical protein